MEKLNSNEINECMNYLENEEVGMSIEYYGRTVEIVDMVGGRYLLLDESGDVSGLVYSTWRAIQFLQTGKVQRIGE